MAEPGDDVLPTREVRIVSIVVTGSIATDHLMQFPGRFAEQLMEGHLEQVSLSFLVDDLQVYRGGVAGNIALGLGRLGMQPLLVGAVGHDFDHYRAWLERHGVVTDHVHVSEDKHTARFLCTTDEDQNQIASFYPGAMSDAAHIDLTGVLDSAGEPELVVICPDDPDAMLRHTAACRDHKVPFAADPSQQIARLDGDALRRLVDGADYLLTNQYERELLLQKTGWLADDVLARVGTWVTTLGADGVHVTTDGAVVEVNACTDVDAVDPTGVGDGFRSGFLTGRLRGLDAERSAQLGCVVAALVLETDGTQEYRFDPDQFVARLRESYGEVAADEIATHLPFDFPTVSTTDPAKEIA